MSSIELWYQKPDMNEPQSIQGKTGSFHGHDVVFVDECLDPASPASYLWNENTGGTVLIRNDVQEYPEHVQKFLLGHELGHISDYGLDLARSESDELEYYCDRYGSELVGSEVAVDAAKWLKEDMESKGFYSTQAFDRLVALNCHKQQIENPLGFSYPSEWETTIDDYVDDIIF